MDYDNRLRVAQHEAGHAVVTVLCGYRLKEVGINEQGGYSDHLEQFDELCAQHGEVETRRCFARIQLAGLRTEKMKFGVMNVDASSQDLADATTNATRIAERTLEDSQQIRRTLEAEVDQLLHDHWPKVEALAKILLHKHHLTVDEAPNAIGWQNPQE